MTFVSSHVISLQVRQSLNFNSFIISSLFQYWDPSAKGVKHSTEIEKKVNEWADLQRSQHLLTNLVQLVLGLRIEVYRADGTTQWYTAVTTGYNATAHEYTLTDDTVLEEHFEDPRLTQMTVLGGRNVLESLLRGDNVVPRRSRSSVANANQVILQGFL